MIINWGKKANTVLQIGTGHRDNLGIISHISPLKHIS